MRFGLTAYPKKSLIIAYSGVSRATRCLKFVLQVAYFVYAKAKALARSCVHADSSEPLPHAHVIRIRTIISCADQFIVLIYHCGSFVLFSYSVL